MSIISRAQDVGGAKEAATTALWAVALLVVTSLIVLVFQTIPWTLAATDWSGHTTSRLDGMVQAGLLTAPLVDFIRTLVFMIVPFALGIFVSLWLLLPVQRGMSLLQVIARGCVASLVAAACGLLVHNWVSGFFGGEDWWLHLVTIVSFAATEAPIVLLVLVVRHLVPRRAHH